MSKDKDGIQEQIEKETGAVVDTTNTMSDETFWDSDDLGDDFFGGEKEDTKSPKEVSSETGIAYEANPENFLNDDDPDNLQEPDKPTDGEKEEPDEPTTGKKPEQKVSESVEEGEEEGGEEEEGEELTPEEKEAQFFKAKAETMIESGIFQTIEEDDIPEELDEQGYIALQEKELNNRVEQTIEGWKSKLGDVGTDFVKFTMEGGKPYDFIKKLDKPDFSEMSVDSEADQFSTVTSYLMHIEGKSYAEAQELAEFHKDKGRLKEKAEGYKSKAVEHEETVRKAAIKAQQEANIRREQNNIEYRKNFSKVVKELDSASFLKIGKGEKKKIEAFATVASEELENGKFVTPLNKKLRDIFAEGGEKLVTLSKLLMNDFDVSKDIVKGTETEVTAKVKTGLAKFAKDNTKIRTTARNTSGKSSRLSDHF